MKIVRNKKKKVIKVKYALFLILLLFFFIFNNISNVFKKQIEIFLLPIQGKIYQQKENFINFFESYNKHQKLKQQNIELEQENQKLKFMLQEKNVLLEENKRLTSLLDLKENLPKEIKFAKVFFRKPENMYDQFYINLGKKDGIQKNMIVAQGNNLIGRVVEVFENTSLVYMLTKEGVVISAKTENHVFGVTKGIGEEKIYLEPTVYDDSLKVGDKIYTSGISDIYPGDIYIGYILEIKKVEDSIFTTIVVKPSVNISEMKEVLLIPQRRENEN